MPHDAQLEAVLVCCTPPLFFFFLTGSVRPHGETQDRNAAQSARLFIKRFAIEDRAVMMELRITLVSQRRALNPPWSSPLCIQN